MSAAATVERGTAPTLFDRTGGEPTLFEGTGGEPTLDEMIVGVWEGLTAHRLVACPVCGSDMRPEYGVHALPVGGRCSGCDSTLR